jgi:hypothetical protein
MELAGARIGMTEPVHLPFLPVVLGVTGHRNPGVGDDMALREAIALVISALREMPGGEHLVIACGLAEGADQIAAEVALQADPPVPLIAISPMPFDLYLNTFETEEGKRRLHDMWRRASLQIELPWVDGDNASHSDEAQFEQLGLVLSRHSHVLLALWDGDDSRPYKRGGTAQVVAMRRWGERAVAGAGLAISLLFEDIPPLLELAVRGPVIQIFTPRSDRRPPAHHAHDKAGTILGLPVDERENPVAISKHSDLTAATKESFGAFADVKDDFFLMSIANDDMELTAKRHSRLCEVHEAYLSPTQLPAALAELRSRQACADVAAARFQRIILGEWTSGLPWSESYRAARARGAWFPEPGALVGFAAAGLLAVLLFEGYAHLNWHWSALVAYMCVLVLASLFYFFVVKPRRWQENFQDYRALAEALRVQFYWAACGLPIAVSDNYLRQHADELGWIRQALRGAALLGIAAAVSPQSIAERRTAFVQWTKDQHAFFVGPDGKGGKSKTNARAKRVVDLLLKILAGLLGIAAIAALTADFLHAGEHRTPFHEWMIVLLGFTPAIVATLIFIAESRSFEAHAHTYRRAGLLHAWAKGIAEDMKVEPGTETWRQLVLELGQEALAENARWLINHRERRIAMRIG